ncbi:MAG TPA: hypothetical protein VF677_00380 [Flavobacterium sp.]|jgi:Fe-S cluster biosynthesis and repair protein YggX
MEDKKQKLDALIKKNEELRPIVFKSFKTDQELDNYEKLNQKAFNQYFDNQKKIQELKLELMTPQDRAEYEENMRLLKLKAEGKPLI